jgi:hypothetical protein
MTPEFEAKMAQIAELRKLEIEKEGESARAHREHNDVSMALRAARDELHQMMRQIFENAQE